MSLRDTVKIPIAVLKVGETRSVMTDLEFPDAPVIFKLIEGNGPVHIHGQHRPDSYDLEDIEEMEEEILDEEEGVSTPYLYLKASICLLHPHTKKSKHMEAPKLNQILFCFSIICRMRTRKTMATPERRLSLPQITQSHCQKEVHTTQTTKITKRSKKNMKWN